MKYPFAILILSIVSLANAFWGPGHNNTAEQEKVNAQIKKSYESRVLAITSPGKHDDMRKTLDDILKGLGPQIGDPLNDWLVLDTSVGVKINADGRHSYQQSILAPFFTARKGYKQAGKMRSNQLFLENLAERYYYLIKEEGESKEVHVVPIAKLKDVTRNGKSIDVGLLAVLGKQKSNVDQLYGIAGIIAEIFY